MNRKFKALVLIAVVLLQITVLSHFTPFGVIPNYTITVLMCVVLINPEIESIVFAGFTGALLDTLTGVPFGVNTLLCIYLAIGCVMISVVVYNTRFTVFVPVCFAFSFVYELIFGVLSCLLRQAVFSPVVILQIVFPVAIANSVVFIPCYEILRRIRFQQKRKGIKYER